MKTVFISLAIAFTSPVFADGLADQNNYIGSGLRSAIGYGLAVNYSRRLASQLLVGSSFAFVLDNKTSQGGSLDTAQYYRDEYTNKMWMIDANATFYFLEDGYLRWGPLIRGGIGHAHSQARGWWGRYDRNPAWIIIGDDKRLLESKEVAMDWDSTFVRFGGYYQFCFNVHEGAKVSHVLEAGVGVVAFDSARTISYTKPNGEYFSRDVKRVNPVVEINYYLAF